MKPTAKQRIARAVEKEAGKVYPKHLLTIWAASKLILAERARLKRGVRKLRRMYASCDTEPTAAENAIDDILALWEG